MLALSASVAGDTLQPSRSRQQPSGQTPPQAGTTGSGGTQPANSNDEDYQRALAPIASTPRPKPQDTQPLLIPQPGIFILNWMDGTSTPNAISTSGMHILRFSNVNNVLYDYQVKIAEIKGSEDDLSAWQAIINETIGSLGTPKPLTGLRGGCTLENSISDVSGKLQQLQTRLSQLLPKKGEGGKYRSVPVSDTIQDWDSARAQYDLFEVSVRALQRALSNTECTNAPQEKNRKAAEDLILNKFPEMQELVIRIQRKRDSPRVLDVNYDLQRTSDYDIVLTETYNEAATEHAPVTFHLNKGYEILTLSGGFLMTKLQARSYSVASQPVAPAPGSPTGTPPTAENVLSVSGLGSGMRAALVVLFNYHDPFAWPLNRRNFGLTLSAGPVYDISQGKADTSRLGVFTGLSVHLWNRLFVTPGVHFGEFADFPQGFHAAGEPVPANFGTPTPVTRWTGHFAIAITFKGKDLSGLVQTQQSSAQPSPSQGKSGK